MTYGTAHGRGSLVTGHDLAFEWPNGTLVFDQLNFQIGNHLNRRLKNRGRRIGLVGRNGSGKTTFLRLILGELEPTQGSLKTTASVAYVAQDRSVLPSDLSGGEAVRAELGKALATNPDLLILDEPTNDLDEDGRAEIQSVLENWPGCLLIVSHDPDCLKRVDEIWEIDSGRLRVFGGGFDFYQKQSQLEKDAARRRRDSVSQERDKIERAAAEAKQRQAKRESRGRKHAFDTGVDRKIRDVLKASGEATAARLGRTHLKRQAEARERFKDAQEAAFDEMPIRIDLPQTKVPSGKRVVETKSFNLSYGAEWLWKTPLDVLIAGPKRILLNGPNGSGKSSLLRALAGASFTRMAGSCELFVEATFLDQRLVLLPQEKSLLETLRDLAPSLSESERRIRLGRFLLTGEQVHKRPVELSGGEKMRAGLLIAFLAEPSPRLLILDEPTNNLDIESRSQFLEALSNFEGAILAVSHDPAFCEGFAAEETWKLTRKGLKAT